MPPPVFFSHAKTQAPYQAAHRPEATTFESHEWLPSAAGISQYRIPFPREAAARGAATTIGSHLEEQQLPELVIFVCFETATFNVYCNAVGWERENELW